MGWLFLLDNLSVGGAQKKIVNIANRLVARGYAIHVAFLSGRSSLLKDLDAMERPVILSDFGWRVGNGRGESIAMMAIPASAVSGSGSTKIRSLTVIGQGALLSYPKGPVLLVLYLLV